MKIRRRALTVSVAAALMLWPRIAVAQGLTGALIVTVQDANKAILVGATVEISSPVLIGGPSSGITNASGVWRFPALPPGFYSLTVKMSGFATMRDVQIYVAGGDIIDKPVQLSVGGKDSITVNGPDSRIDTRGVGVATTFRAVDYRLFPTTRATGFELLKSAPGISATSRTSPHISAFGSGIDQNLFLLDGATISAASNGVARADIGRDFIHELQVQSIGASVEYGHVQGAVVNLISKSGGNVFQSDVAYYAQPASLTSQPVRQEPIPGPGVESGYERAKYHDFAATLGGPLARDRVWFFAGYQYLRDFDSQPGTDPALPRKFEQDKVFVKMTYLLAKGWQLTQSFHGEYWTNPETPTSTKPPGATQVLEASIPVINFGHLVHASATTVWDLSVGRFRYSQDTSPWTGNRETPNRLDNPGGYWSNAPQQIGAVRQIRTTAKATVTRYGMDFLGVDHELKVGGQVDRGEHRSLVVLPGGTRDVYMSARLVSRFFQEPANAGGRFIAAGAFLGDAVKLGTRSTINAGLRFDYVQAVSQPVQKLDANGIDTGVTIPGRGTLYTWNILSPRFGVVVKLDSTGRTLLRASYGLFSQGILTGEVSPFHLGQTITERQDFQNGVPGGRVIATNPANLEFDPSTRPPRTDEFSVGVDRELGREVAVAVAYVRKDGRNFIAWKNVNGRYLDKELTFPDGRHLVVQNLDTSVTKKEDLQFQLTNPPDLSLTYDGVVMVVEKRRSHGWQAFGSYTWSKAYGMQPSSGTTADGAQVATVGAPPVNFSRPLTFGQDPNDFINASGRLPNDRPIMLRMMVAADVPRTGLVVAANFQHFSGKPWTATTTVLDLAQDPRAGVRVLIEPRGSRRLSSQTRLDIRLARSFRIGSMSSIDLAFDLFNALNDTAEERVATDEFYPAPDQKNYFGQPNLFIDPRRAMLSLRLNLGR